MTEAEEPHVILYFDVNKTVIMHDPVQGKDLAHILNDLLTESALGSVTEDGESGEATWRWNGRHMTTGGEAGSGDDQYVSYGRFLRAKYPMSTDPATANRNKKVRKVLRQDFTSPGNAGEALAHEHRVLLESLELPIIAGDEQQRQAMQAAGLLQENESDDAPQYFFIVPAFFRLLQHLHARGTRFNLVFRTYGDDLARIATEFNCFCEGKHPFFQLNSSYPLMDGRNGGVDRRIHLSPVGDNGDAHRFGTFLRSHELTALVMGTFVQPRADDESHDLTFYEASLSRLQVVTGIPAIHEFLTTKWRERQATLAIRDFYPFWFRNCEDARAGKLMTVDPSGHENVHVMFFDDNILPHEPHIVDARDARDGTPLDFLGTTKDAHLLRVEPLEAICNQMFFIERFEASLENTKKKRLVATAMELSSC